MLFILVMDVLNLIVTRASDEGLLQPLSSRSIQHRVSLYADDVVIFLQPDASDVDLIVRILHLFGETSDLKTNILKSNVAPNSAEPLTSRLCSSISPAELKIFPSSTWGYPYRLRNSQSRSCSPSSTVWWIFCRDGNWN
jgi:hypothetical protein